MLISPDEAHANTVLDGMAWASEKLGVPIVGGHLTLGHEPALSASCTGFARRPLRASNAQPGDTLVAAFATEGRWMSDTQPFWTSLHDRDDTLLKTDGDALVTIAEHELAHAARDVSMPGIAGSLLQMIEGAGCGANLNVEAIPRPDGAPVERWLMVFPSFGFLLATQQPEAVCDVFARHGIAAAVCGGFDDTRVLRLNEFPAWDLNETPLTGLSPSAGA
jgi:selenophosphate synthetase-related protein